MNDTERHLHTLDLYDNKNNKTGALKFHSELVITRAKPKPMSPLGHHFINKATSMYKGNGAHHFDECNI